ncbi:M15 family peptidase [Dysgonomonas sp. 511]|nr:M15 family peptidase [Dysgonomonas sp. 511]
MYKFGERSLKNMEGVHPLLVELLMASIPDSPVDFTVVEGLRTTKRQQELYAQGRTKPGAIVTKVDGVKKLSNHQDEADGVKDGLGCAVDIYPFFKGQVQVNHKDTHRCLKLISDHIKAKAKELGLTVVWGGDWGWDYPHFELKL